MSERKRIYLCLAHMSEAGLEQKYIQEAFDTNWVVPLGPNVNGFEKDLEEFLASKASPRPSPQGEGGFASHQVSHKGVDGDSRRVVALSSGTAAIHLALVACGVGPGDEVCTQSFTFCASANPIAYLGATPVFIDSEPDTWNMDPELLEVAIKDRIAKTGKKPKAIVPVSLFGMPYRIDKIMEIANRYEIPVIEDAAEGLGSRFNGRPLGTFGRYGVLSFNGNKMITTSGGGALICSSLTPDPSPIGRGEEPYKTADPTLYELLKGYSSEMRKKPTEAESVAWGLLRDNQTGYKFRRQHVIGDYIVDFVCLEKMLVVEIDGEYHNEWEQQIDDAARTEWLAIKGFRVMRFTNAEVLSNPEEFLKDVIDALAHQNTLPVGEGWGGAQTIMWLATQARESYPYYQHEKIGYNYRMSNICAGIGRGQMTVLGEHLEHHKHVQGLYEQLLADVSGIHVHSQPNVNDNLNANTPVFDSNYWLCTICLDPDMRIKGQENAYKVIVQGAVGGAAGVTHAAECVTTDCQPNDNVEALRVFMDAAGVEARPVWKPMHKQPVYLGGEVKVAGVGCQDSSFKFQEGEILCQTSDKSVAYVNGVSEAIFKVGMCLPAGPYVTDDDVRYIVQCIKDAII
ncbi:MAG: aminotransferase class I/II-fold pyridoxal phosphate-dependent enzyme [Bacteroidales bacterium]|nr:aminotransferase class I/II-fold pyridoxal phosphate-dependent enzyme [Bacteroidales bacterium]